MIKEKAAPKEQNITLENRSRLVITGVTDTDRFDESSVLLYTVMGELLIKGKDLKVSGLSVENGEMTVEGQIGALIYGDTKVTGPLSFIGRLLK